MRATLLHYHKNWPLEFRCVILSASRGALHRVALHCLSRARYGPTSLMPCLSRARDRPNRIRGFSGHGKKPTPHCGCVCFPVRRLSFVCQSDKLVIDHEHGLTGFDPRAAPHTFESAERGSGYHEPFEQHHGSFNSMGTGASSYGPTRLRQAKIKAHGATIARSQSLVQLTGCRLSTVRAATQYPVVLARG